MKTIFCTLIISSLLITTSCQGLPDCCGSFMTIIAAVSSISASRCATQHQLQQDEFRQQHQLTRKHSYHSPRHSVLVELKKPLHSLESVPADGQANALAPTASMAYIIAS
jgi:hypothetical protein